MKNALEPKGRRLRVRDLGDRLRRPILALDLGTENTRICSEEPSSVIVRHPTLVAVDDVHQTLLAFGESAQRMMGREPPGLRVISPISEGVIASPTLAERFLARLIRQSSPSRLVRPQLVIAVPAAASSVQRHALATSASLAGAGRSTLLKESLTAGLGAGLPVFEPEASLIVELGASKTEVAILALGGVVAARSVPIGSAQLSAAISTHLRRRHQLLIGRVTADAVKMTLGCVATSHEPRWGRVAGRDVRRGLPVAIELKSHDLVDPIQAALGPIVKTIRELLEETPPEPSADIARTGIWLSGGTARLAGLPDFLARATGLTARVVPDPENSVVRGCLACARDPELLRAMEPPD